MGGEISQTRAKNGVFALSKVKKGPNMVLNGPRKEVTLVIKGLKMVYFFYSRNPLYGIQNSVSYRKLGLRGKYIHFPLP